MSRICILIAPVPVHCFSITFIIIFNVRLFSRSETFFERRLIIERLMINCY